ncbi:MAG: Multi-sensor signal transduction histidine kinase [Verrucomicrobiales bacterium]|nr:Multi-sensor signal transduction histidine kinase [Verrucomicrobiales bacterium]
MNGAARSGGKGVNILLVDDRDDKLLALEAILSTLGQNLVKARSGKDALRWLLKEEFAVILLDVTMPGIDGFETASLIRKRPSTEHTPIIFVTSVSASETNIYKGYSLGAVDYILSPILPDVLRAKVSVFVELYNRAEQIKEQSERLRQAEEREHQRRLAEAADLLDRETKRNRFFTLSLDLLAIADFSGYILQSNPAWESTLGYSEEELKARSGLDLAHPDDYQSMYAKFEELKQGTCTTYFEGRYRCRDGTYKWLGWTAAPFISDKLIYIFARDITRRKEAEEKVQNLNQELNNQLSALTETNRQLEAFNYSISHDLRAPLRSMQCFAQALLDECASGLGPEGQDYAERIIKSSHYMDALLRDLLQYSRVARSELSLSPVNLDAVIRDALDQNEKEIIDKKAVVEIRNPLASVIGHPMTLVQMLANLIGNALKFVQSPALPLIKIYTEPVDGLVRIWVEDNGIGIAPEHQGKIFDLFVRLHSNSSYSGTGVGLAIVQKGAERMSGSVGVSSKPGIGSRFWIELPANLSKA